MCVGFKIRVQAVIVKLNYIPGDSSVHILQTLIYNEHQNGISKQQMHCTTYSPHIPELSEFIQLVVRGRWV